MAEYLISVTCVTSCAYNIFWNGVVLHLKQNNTAKMSNYLMIVLMLTLRSLMGYLSLLLNIAKLSQLTTLQLLLHMNIWVGLHAYCGREQKLHSWFNTDSDNPPLLEKSTSVLKFSLFHNNQQALLSAGAVKACSSRVL